MAKPHEADAFMDMDLDGTGRRLAVCVRCHCKLQDCEPAHPRGEFWHRTEFPDGSKSKCKNAGRQFFGGDKEIEPFMRKRERRLRKRAS